MAHTGPPHSGSEALQPEPTRHCSPIHPSPATLWTPTSLHSSMTWSMHFQQPLLFSPFLSSSSALRLISLPALQCSKHVSRFLSWNDCPSSAGLEVSPPSPPAHWTQEDAARVRQMKIGILPLTFSSCVNVSKFLSPLSFNNPQSQELLGKPSDETLRIPHLFRQWSYTKGWKPLNLDILKKRKEKSILICLFVSCEVRTTLPGESMTTLNVYRCLNTENIHVYTHVFKIIILNLSIKCLLFV